jgi:hypothetical protein
MRFRPVVLCAVLLAMTLGAAGCSSGGSNAPAATTGRAPTGTVVVKSGGKVICVIKLKNGTGTCTMSTKNYQPGSVPLSASYSGDSGFKPSQTSTTLKLLQPTAAPSSP